MVREQRDTNLQTRARLVSTLLIGPCRRFAAPAELETSNLLTLYLLLDSS